MALLDLDRALPMIRTGVQAALRRQGWRLTIAGAQVRRRPQAGVAYLLYMAWATPLGAPVWGPPSPDPVRVRSAAETRRPWSPVP